MRRVRARVDEVLTIGGRMRVHVLTSSVIESSRASDRSVPSRADLATHRANNKGIEVI